MLLLGSYTINILGQKFCSPWNLFRIADLHFVWFFQNLFTIRVYWPYTIILISKTGNPTRLLGPTYAIIRVLRVLSANGIRKYMPTEK